MSLELRKIEEILNFIKSNPQLETLSSDSVASIKKLSLHERHVLFIKCAEWQASAPFYLLLNDPEINLNYQDKMGNTALIYSAKGKNRKFISELISKNATIALANVIGDTALHIAINTQDIPLLEMLWNACNPTTQFEEPLLIAAIKMNAIKVVEFLLERDCDPNVTDQLGNSALYHALYSAHRDRIISLLFEAHSLINVANQQGETPIFVVTRRFPYLFDDFYKRGADYTLSDNKGKNLLMHAAECGNTNLILSLLSLGIAINQQDLKGETALFHAVREHHKATVSLLLEQGASIEHRNKHHQTALLIAGDEMIDFLIRKGANSSELETADIVDEPLPEFKYCAPEEIKRQLSISFSRCDCCKKKRKFLFKEPFVKRLGSDGDDDDEIYVCPWCIASGAFYKKFKTIPTRNELDTHLSCHLTKKELNDFYRLTPHFNSWQGLSWPLHCHVPCTFMGNVGWAEIAAIKRPIEMIEWGLLDYSDPRFDWIKDLEREGAPTGYLFECQTCQKLLLLYDTD